MSRSTSGPRSKQGVVEPETIQAHFGWLASQRNTDPMPVACPKCGSRNLRYAHFRSFSERWKSWIGIRPLRCRDCRLRFVERTWRFSNLVYARCPQCWRMDLSSWSERDFHVTFGMRVLLAFGGTPYRCEYCRRNFVSFRKRKERFSFKRWKRLSEERKARQQQQRQQWSGNQGAG